MKDTLTIVMVIVVGVIIVSFSTEENIVREIVLGEESTEESFVREFVRVEKIKEGVQGVKEDIGLDKLKSLDVEGFKGVTEGQFEDLLGDIDF